MMIRLRRLADPRKKAEMNVREIVQHYLLPRLATICLALQYLPVRLLHPWHLVRDHYPRLTPRQRVSLPGKALRWLLLQYQDVLLNPAHPAASTTMVTPGKVVLTKRYSVQRKLSDRLKSTSRFDG